MLLQPFSPALGVTLLAALGLTWACTSPDYPAWQRFGVLIVAGVIYLLAAIKHAVNVGLFSKPIPRHERWTAGPGPCLTDHSRTWRGHEVTTTIALDDVAHIGVDNAGRMHLRADVDHGYAIRALIDADVFTENPDLHTQLTNALAPLHVPALRTPTRASTATRERISQIAAREFSAHWDEGKNVPTMIPHAAREPRRVHAGQYTAYHR